MASSLSVGRRTRYPGAISRNTAACDTIASRATCARPGAGVIASAASPASPELGSQWQDLCSFSRTSAQHCCTGESLAFCVNRERGEQHKVPPHQTGLWGCSIKPT